MFIPKKPKLRHGDVFNAANFITLGSLASSLLIITNAIDGRFHNMGLLFLLALACDGLDGFVARKLRIASKIGMRLDSLVDLVSFGIAPAIVAGVYCQMAGGMQSHLLQFVYVACTAIRLARFNVQENQSIFYGLNSPSAASLVIFLIWMLDDAFAKNPPQWAPLAVMVSVALAAYMMVSPFTYASSKKFKIKLTMINMLTLASGFFFSVLYAPYTLYVCIFIYTLSGPCMALYRRWFGLDGK